MSNPSILPYDCATLTVLRPSHDTRYRMFNPKIRDDVFPFVCENPACQQQYDEKGFKGLLTLWGLVYADCGNFIYQGVTCRKCKQTSIKPLPRDNPLVDLRDFIIVPNLNPAANTWEQFIQRERAKDEHDFLKFKCIPAWEDETIGYVDIINRYPSDSYALYTTPGVPYLMMIPGDVERKQEKENETGEIQLRRLYPDTPKFRNLLVCLSPSRISRIEVREEGVSPKWSEGDPKEIQQKRAAWVELLKETAGESLKEAVRSRLESKGFSGLDENTFQETLERNLWLLQYDPTKELQRLSTRVGFEETIWQDFEDAVRPVIHPICTEMALSQDRKKVLSWANRTEQGRALFVDAPMGLGKTYSIAEALAENGALSAVIFMPTAGLCREIVAKLKIRIAQKQGLKYWRHFDYEQGFVPVGLKRELLEKEVYYVDSINEKECPYHDQLIDGYRHTWTFDRDTCDECEKKPYCRFISHWQRAPLSRIVVATHHEYDPFYEQPSMHRWFKEGLDREEDAVLRDVFVVDEEFVLSKCYQPVALDARTSKAVSEKLTEFLSPYENAKQALGMIGRLFGQIKDCDHTAVTRPIDREFRFPKNMIEDWKESLHHQHASTPEALHDFGMVGDYLEIVEKAIRLGLVLHRDNRSLSALFPNPKAYDLSRLPPHAFLDGTAPHDRFLKKKLLNVQFKRMSIGIKPFWRLRVIQNVNTDLPGKDTGQNGESVKEFVGDLLKELGKDHKYLIITWEPITKEYLENFLKKEYPEWDLVIAQHGGPRGVDYGKDRDIAIVLGGFVPSDALEIAMALEFIRDTLPNNEVTAAQPDLWTWKEGAGQRVYKNDYAIVAELAEALRFSEQRQALAMAGYLLHDVDFYILSKDPVSDYEPFLPLPETDQYRADIFAPKFRRKDSKYERVKETVLDWLREHDSVTVMEIHRQTGIRRGTVGEHLKQMEKENELVRRGKKYRLRS
jgi:hypothetical protein